MKRIFSKMSGLGNDFILFDDMAKGPNDSCIKMDSELAIYLCDRRMGIGADGIIILRNAEDADVADITWEFYNSDGSVGEMCGNAIRCVACYVFERDLWPLSDDVCENFDPSTATTAEKEAAYGQLRVETLAGVKSVDVVLGDVGRAVEDGSTDEDVVIEAEGVFLAARVDMGIAEIDTDVEIGGRTYSRVSMGNPHAVTFVDKLPREFGTAPITTEGPAVEVDPIFPNKTNVEFAEIEDSRVIQMRVWERGAGETYACGTGACATVVAAQQKGLVAKDKDIVVQLVGGTLVIEVKDDLRVFMTGPAMEVFTGSIDIDCGPCEENPCLSTPDAQSSH